MRVLHTASGEVLGLTFSPDGRALAAAVEGQGVYLWNLESPGRPLQLDDTATDRARELYFSPDSRSVGWLAPDPDGWKVYDRDTRRARQLRLSTPGPLYWLSQTPDGGRVVSQHSFVDPALTGWELGAHGWERLWSVSTLYVAIHSQAICPTGRRVAGLARNLRGRKPGEDPFRLELRSAVSGVVEATARYPYHEHYPLVFSPDGSQLVGVHEMTLLVWPVPALGDPQLVRNDTRKHFTAVAFHPAGKYLFATNNDASVHMFDTAGWSRVARFTWDLGRLRAVAVALDGTLAAAGGDRGEVVVWDVDL
ncbi:MAG: domain, G-beta repeat [Gemmataceae bacterium]|nr:domain, G-beta repeat [Gemmataceae bacterium]